jgi:DNA-binding SARP family transcriptional activator
MTVEFRLLGELDALIDGCPVDTGHARQRCVLAALLVEVNRVVPVDQLIDRVWADRPPHRARNALSAYLSRLRQQLAAADVPITRVAGGYRLVVDPQAVDLHRFRSLVRQARADTDPGRAADGYERALELWRGEPFAAIDTPWFAGVRATLQAERLAAVLDRNDAALRAGRHRDLLAELAGSVRAHPLDERLAGQLMLALFRSGRQADVLDTYRQLRERLRDELGADPGTALRAVHQQISPATATPRRPPRTRGPHARRAGPHRRPPPGCPRCRSGRSNAAGRWSAAARWRCSTSCAPPDPGASRWCAARPASASRRWSRRSPRRPPATCGCCSGRATHCSRRASWARCTTSGGRRGARSAPRLPGMRTARPCSRHCSRSWPRRSGSPTRCS